MDFNLHVESQAAIHNSPQVICYHFLALVGVSWQNFKQENDLKGRGRLLQACHPAKIPFMTGDPSQPVKSKRYTFRRRSAGPLEKIRLSFGQFLARSVIDIVVGCTGLAALIAGVCAVVFVGVALVVDITLLRALPVGAAAFFGCVWCFSAVLTFAPAFVHAIFERTQRFRVKGDLFIVEIGFKQRVHNLAECSWRNHEPTLLERCFGETGRLVVWGDNDKYYLGFADKAASEWRQYFKTRKVEGNSGGRLSLSWFLVMSWCGAVTGAGVALGIALLFPALGGPGESKQAIIVLGYLDGFFAVCCRELFREQRFHRFGVFASVCILAIACAGFAFALQIVPWQIAAWNALAGAIVGWLVFPAKPWRDV